MKRWLLLMIPLVFVCGLVFWRWKTKSADAVAQSKQREAMAKTPPLVTVSPASVKDIVHDFNGVGTVEAPFNVKLAPKITGLLVYLLKREGDPVKAGEILARIDPTQIQTQIEQQKATVAQAEQRLAQAQLTQNPTNVNVYTQIDQQKAGLRSAKADAYQTEQNYAAQVAAAQSAVVDAQGRLDSAIAMIGNAEAGIRSAQASLDNAQVKYNRTLDLYTQGYVAAQDVDDAKTSVKVAQEALGGAQAQLKSAQSGRNSAEAQKEAAQKQVDITVTKGKADIDSAKARVTQADAAFRYAGSNRAQVGAYRANLAALRQDVIAAQAQLRNLESQLSDTNIRSTINGFVTARYADPGSIASPTQPILAVQEIRDIYVTVSVQEEYSRQVTDGKIANVLFDALPGRTFTGKITQVNPAADPQSRQFAIRVTLDNSQNLIKPGMFARVTVPIEHVPNAVVVPREAVLHGKEGAYVVVVGDGNVAHRRMVTPGTDDVSDIVILNGLQAGENVVTLSKSPVKDGQVVRIGGAQKSDLAAGKGEQKS